MELKKEDTTMKNKDLQKLLSQYDPELEVLLADWAEKYSRPNPDIKIHVDDNQLIIDVS